MLPPLNLCYITDRRALGPRPPFDKLKAVSGAEPLLPLMVEAVRAGIDLIQVREKDLGTRELLELVLSALNAARGTATRIVVNDRLDVALAAAAAGVHLGRQSLPARAARACVPEGFLVGVSCHSLDESLAAESAGASYILLGPIFETLSKLAFGPPLGLAKLREVTARLKTPVLVLGGITVERVRPCLEAGAVGIAGISIFQDCPSLEARVRELRAEFAARKP